MGLERMRWLFGAALMFHFGVPLLQAQSINENKYRQESGVCSVLSGSFSNSGSTTSLLHCAKRCSEDNSCVSYVYDKYGKTCSLSDTALSTVEIGCHSNLKFGQVKEFPFTVTMNGSSTTSPHTSSSTASTTSEQTTTPSVIPTTSSSFSSTSGKPDAADIGEFCIVDFDCADPYSACMNSICTCMLEFVFDYASKMCVSITACITYGETFKKVDGYKFTDAFYTTLSGITEDECQSACATDGTYDCKIAVFEKVLLDCYLHEITALSADLYLYYTTNTKFELFERECKQPLKSINESCSTDFDCWEFDSFCINSVCRCDVETSYDPNTHSCVDQCYLYSNAMGQYPGEMMDSFLTDMSYDVGSVQQCQDQCLIEASFYCISAMFDATSSVCKLSATSLKEMSGGHSSTPGFTLTQRECTLMTSPIEDLLCFQMQCPTSNSECRDGKCKCTVGLRYDLPTDSCVQGCTEFGSTFQTIVDLYLDTTWGVAYPLSTSEPERECKALCVTETSIVCKMAMYDDSLKKCSLTSINFLAIPTENIATDPNFTVFQRDCNAVA